MKVHNYIKTALDRRGRAAYAFIKNDSIISDFINKNNIDCEFTNCHIASLCEPDTVYEATIRDIGNFNVRN